MNDGPVLNVPPQRWLRKLKVAPGFWKTQLPTKHLELAARGDLEGLRALLAAQPEFLNKPGAQNRTLLWEAARKGRLDVVQWLVERGAEIDPTGCYNGETMVQVTPYVAAVYYRRPRVAAYLLEKGARLDVFRAAFLGEQARVEQELAARPELLAVEDPLDWTYHMPLVAFAVAGADLSLTRLLLERGAEVAPYSTLLLLLAAKVGRLDLAELLLAHGAEARAVDGGTFGVGNDLAVLEYLLQHGASATHPGVNGQTPLQYVTRADKARRPDKVRLLIQYGAVPN